MIFINKKFCPACEFPLDINIFGICSQLGPARVLCRRCGEAIGTGRCEWAQMQRSQRAWCLAIFAFYLVLGGVLGGNGFYASVQMWHGHIVVENFPLDSPEFRVWMGIAGLLTFGGLVSKAVSSKRRSRRNDQPASRISLLSADFTFGGQLKMMALFSAPFVIAWLTLRSGMR